MFDDVPDPVWKTSIGNSASCSPAGDGVPRDHDVGGEIGVDETELGIRLGGRRLDAPEPVNDTRRDRLAGDVEVLDRFGRLGTPEHLATLPRSMHTVNASGSYRGQLTPRKHSR